MQLTKKIKDSLVKEVEQIEPNKLKFTTYALDLHKDSIVVYYDHFSNSFSDGGKTLKNFNQEFTLNIDALDAIHFLAKFYGAKIVENEIVVFGNRPDKLSFSNEVTCLVSAIIAINSIELIQL